MSGRAAVSCAYAPMLDPYARQGSGHRAERRQLAAVFTVAPAAWVSRSGVLAIGIASLSQPRNRDDFRAAVDDDESITMNTPSV